MHGLHGVLKLGHAVIDDSAAGYGEVHDRQDFACLNQSQQRAKLFGVVDRLRSCLGMGHIHGASNVVTVEDKMHLDLDIIQIFCAAISMLLRCSGSATPCLPRLVHVFHS